MVHRIFNGRGGDGDRTRGAISFDNIMLKDRKNSLVLFIGSFGAKKCNGSFSWGNSSAELVTGAGTTTATNALNT